MPNIKSIDPDMTAEMIADAFDLERLPAEFFADPYPFYKALQVHRPLKQLGPNSYLLTRYADLSAVYRDPKKYSSDKKVEFKPKFGDSPLYEHHTTSLVFNDPPLHTRVRRLIAGALTPQAMAEMEPGIRTLVDRLIDEMERKGDVDLIDDFAAAIPVEVIANLFGVPKEEREPLRGWSLSILAALEPAINARVNEIGNTAVRDFLAYLDHLIARRRVAPGDPARDMITRLLQEDDQGDKLTAAELLHNCIFLLNAGHETTTNLIGNALVLLARHPAQRGQLAANPRMIKPAIDEILRFESPVQLGNRICATTCQIGEQALPAGTLVTLCIGAANRDPAVFPEPDRFDISRSPNRHLAFAAGVHQCAGLNLARLEATVAVSRLVARHPNYEVSKEPVLAGRARFRGYSSVPASVKR